MPRLSRMVFTTLLSLVFWVSSAYAEPRIVPPLDEILAGFTPDPTAEAQIIQRTTHVHLDSDLSSQVHSYVAVYINSSVASRDYSQMGISFNSHFEQLELQFARVRAQDGRVFDIQPSATQIQNSSSENFYHDGQELLFSLPNVRVGSVIEFQFVREMKRELVPGHWFDAYRMHWLEGRAASQGVRVDPVHRAEIQVSAPASLNLVEQITEGYSIQRQRRVHDDRQQLIWRAQDLPTLELQEGMPRERGIFASVSLSSLQSWSGVVQWGEQLFAPHMVTDEALTELAEQLRQQGESPSERVEAVYQWLQEQVRYVFAHVGRGGYEPHSAPDVLANGYGDCKDQTVLAVTLLRQLGVEAYPALIATRGMGLPDTQVPRLPFDHMLVYLPEQEGLAETWLDTTGERSLFPGHSLALEGQPALVIAPEVSAPVTVPTRGADYHHVRIDVTFKPVDDQSFEAELTLALSGIYEQHLRGMWLYSPERERHLREMIQRIYPGADSVTVSGHHAEDLWTPFQVRARLHFADAWPGAQEAMTYGFGLQSIFGWATGFTDLDLPENRVQDYVVDPSYSFTAQIFFPSPSEYHQAHVISRSGTFDNRFFTLTQEGAEEKGGYRIQQQLTVPSQRLTAKEYADYYAQVQQLVMGPTWQVQFRYDKAQAELMALQQHTDSDPAASQIGVARHHMRYGQYALALTSAEQAVEYGPDNGEAHYVLGLAQGYQNLFSESDQSFRKARELGYRP